MANIKSAIKRIRSSARKQKHNRVVRGQARTAVKNAHAALSSRKADEAQASIQGDFVRVSGKDRDTLQEVMQLLGEIAHEQGRSVVVCSHDQRIRQVADRVLWLEDGEIVEAR